MTNADIEKKMNHEHSTVATKEKIGLKFIGWILGGLILAFIAVWGVSLLKCEFLSNKYGADLFDAYIGNEDVEYWIDGYSDAKVISVDNTEGKAQVYYIVEYAESKSGVLVEYEKSDGKWTPSGSVDHLWVKGGGNADDVIWPYWHHYFMG